MTTGFSATVGAWDVSVSPVSGVQAGKRSSGETFSASLTLFPIGYRVGPHWTNGLTDCTEFIPETVKRKARALAGRLTK